MSNTICRTCEVEIPDGRSKYCNEHRNERAIKQQEKEQSNISSGKCKVCSTELSKNSAVFCDTHLVANRERGVKDRERRKKLGICRSCNNELSPKSKTWCEEHRLQQNEISRNLSRKARENEMCIDCDSVPRLPRKRRCSNCQLAYDVIKASTCRRVGCEEPTEIKHFCRTHADEENEKLRQRRENLQKQNKCIFCFKEMKPDNTSKYVLCLECRNKQKTQRTTTSE